MKTLIKCLCRPLSSMYLHEICKSGAHGKNINLQALFGDGNILKKKGVSLIITKYVDTGTINWWSGGWLNFRWNCWNIPLNLPCTIWICNDSAKKPNVFLWDVLIFKQLGMLWSKFPFGIQIGEIGQIAREQRSYRIVNKVGFSRSSWAKYML